MWQQYVRTSARTFKPSFTSCMPSLIISSVLLVWPSCIFCKSSSDVAPLDRRDLSEVCLPDICMHTGFQIAADNRAEEAGFSVATRTEYSLGAENTHYRSTTVTVPAGPRHSVLGTRMFSRTAVHHSWRCCSYAQTIA
jgi:hypothetical protein